MAAANPRAMLRRWRNLGGLCLLVLVLGALFRLGNLHQVYWHDEAYTSQRIAGYTAAEVRATLFNGTVVSPAEILAYQQPTGARRPADTVRVLARDNSQHPPLYYLLARQWALWLGAAPWKIRSLSAACSLLAIPAVYWLWQALFALVETDETPPKLTRTLKRRTAWLAMAVVAISPFHILYAQEARQYALWTVLILLSCIAFLRALRLNTARSWGLYALSLVASLYTHILTIPLALGQAMYLLALERCRPTRRAAAYALAALASLVAFAPWLAILVRNWSVTGSSWSAVPIPLAILLKMWGLHAVRLVWLTPGDFNFDTLAVYVLLPLVLLLSGGGFYLLCRSAPWRLWFFLSVLTGASFLSLALPDLVLGGQRSTAGRYLVPAFLGMQMAIAFGLATLLASRQRFKRHVARGAIALIVAAGCWSGLGILQAETNWTKVINYNLPALARAVNERPQPLLLSEATGINTGTILALAHRLEPSVRLWVSPRPSPVAEPLPALLEFSDILLLNPSDPLRAAAERQIGADAQLVFNDFHLYLWRLAPPDH